MLKSKKYAILYAFLDGLLVAESVWSGIAIGLKNWLLLIPAIVALFLTAVIKVLTKYNMHKFLFLERPPTKRKKVVPIICWNCGYTQGLVRVNKKTYRCPVCGEEIKT